MKRIIYIVCAIALLLCACSVPQKAATTPAGNATHGIYKLTFKTKQISNQFVGNDWSFTYTCNGETIQSGYQITYSLEVFTFLPIAVTVTEKDKISDIGTGTLSVALCDGGSGKTEITVTENAGAFKGNTAVWEVSCEVALVGKK